MISTETARKIILSMPEAEEQEHHGHPDFRVRNKIFATLWPAERRSVLKIRFDADAGWLKSSKQALSEIKWGKQRWTNVNLQFIDSKAFRQLVEDAWYAVAPPVMAAKLISERREPE
ncbi:MAG TPA: MmcQ/YjbR family DNA-binding protein [Chthoniobacterales bacterium]|nr:MmcQ/YjbR family DNA-binding protein [Chthoniobacterales bacterium]